MPATARLQRLILDAWTALSHKEQLDNTQGRGALAPSWVGDEQRRLTAYKLLLAYQDNASRFFLPSTVPDREFRDRREYGDAALIVNVVLGALLGDDQSIVVEGADDDPPEDAPEGALSSEAQRQDWLAQWALDERLRLKMIETERNSVGIGDGLYVVSWSSKKQRPALRVFDPGFYFPVLHSGNEDDYPGTVHIAWEEQPEQGETLVHRITYRLAPIRPQTADDLPLLDDQGALVLQPGDFWLEDGVTIARQLPFNDEPSTLTCYMTEATWSQKDLDAKSVDDFSYDRARFAINADGEQIRDLDLGIDFVPAVHVPNTVALLNHYGKSVIATVLQILDDLQMGDTDLWTTAKLLGFPPLVVSGVGKGAPIRLQGQSPSTALDTADNGTTDTYQPGTVWKVPEGGKLDMLDTSRALDALVKYVEFLLNRLSVNARTPESVLGRVQSKDVSSGVQLAMMFGPLQQMVAEMRMVRDEKYPLLLKFVQRFALLGGLIEGPVMPASVAFGSYLPSDRSATMSLVTTGLMAHAISTHTAVNMLVEVGLPIEDAQEEVARIEHENYEAAVQLLAALGSETEVATYLGRTPPSGPAPPPITLPNLGQGG